MSYTWGYLKDATLAKLDLTVDEATTQNLLSRFPFYANEAMTQICSSVKPKYSFAKFEITKDDVGKPQKMPEDFVSFGDDVSYEIKEEQLYVDDSVMVKEQLHSCDFDYLGTNKVVFKRKGTFYISYNATWFVFDKSTDLNIVIDAPNDVLDCIPSFVASQCYKIDDEYKSSVFRNEYEIMLSRIDNTHYKEPRDIYIEGGW